MIKKCLVCGREFSPRNKTHRFCSGKCRYKYHNGRRGYSEDVANSRKKHKSHYRNKPRTFSPKPISADELCVNIVESNVIDSVEQVNNADSVVEASADLSVDNAVKPSFFRCFVNFFKSLFKG